MKSLFTVLYFFLICLSTSLGQVKLHWASKYDGPVADDQGNTTIIDGKGNIYVAGSTDGVSGTKDYIIIKYNNNGDTLWTRTYNGIGNGQDEALAVILDSKENVIVTGKSMNQQNFDIVTIKYDLNGNLTWVSRFNGTYNTNDIGYNMDIDPIGNIYLVGGSESNGGIVIKYNRLDGTILWSTVIPGNYNNKFLITRNPSDGNIIAVSGTDIYSITYIQVLDSNGNLVRSFNKNCSKCLYGIPNDIELDINGNLFVTTSEDLSHNSPQQVTTAKFEYNTQAAWPVWLSWTYLTGWTGELKGVETEIDNINNTLFILSDLFDGTYRYNHLKKISANTGDEIFRKTYRSGTGVNEFPKSLILSKQSNPPDKFYVLGNVGNGDINIAAFSTTNGDSLWNKRYDCGNKGIDYANAMTVDKCDNIYITGYSNCNGSTKDIQTLKFGLQASINPRNANICQGSSITISTNPCASCSYKWNTGETTPSITVSPASSTSYIVSVTNASGCISLSDSSNITIINKVQPSVIINASATTICEGQPISFTASIVNGGSKPTFQWLVNNINQSGSTSTFTSSNLKNGDAVRCVLTSNANCAEPTLVFSNIIVVYVNQILPASISITGSKQTICAGESIEFTATTVNGGTNPDVEWFVNNLPVSKGLLFTTNNIADGNLVYCKMSSKLPCSEPAISVSNILQIKVNQNLSPSIKIGASSTSICQGNDVLFTAMPTNGGVPPGYEWYVDGNLRQKSTQATFKSSTMNNNDQVYCRMISSELCATPKIVSSNIISIAVDSIHKPQISITASSTSILQCEEVVFKASYDHGGSLPTLQWYIDSDLISSATSEVFKTNDLKNGNQVYCKLNSNERCVSPSQVYSNAIIMNTTPLPQPQIIKKSDSLLVANYNGLGFEYYWYRNGTFISNEPNISLAQHGFGLFYVVVKLNNCTVTSQSVEIVATDETQEITSFDSYPNPFTTEFVLKASNIQDEFLIICIYNSVGEKIMETNVKPTNGTFTKLFHLENLRPGIYFMQINSKIQHKIMRLFKKN